MNAPSLIRNRFAFELPEGMRGFVTETHRVMNALDPFFSVSIDQARSLFVRECVELDGCALRIKDDWRARIERAARANVKECERTMGATA